MEGDAGDPEHLTCTKTISRVNAFSNLGIDLPKNATSELSA